MISCCTIIKVSLYDCFEVTAIFLLVCTSLVYTTASFDEVFRQYSLTLIRIQYEQKNKVLETLL